MLAEGILADTRQTPTAKTVKDKICLFFIFLSLPLGRVFTACGRGTGGGGAKVREMETMMEEVVRRARGGRGQCTGTDPVDSCISCTVAICLFRVEDIHIPLKSQLKQLQQLQQQQQQQQLQQQQQHRRLTQECPFLLLRCLSSRTLAGGCRVMAARDVGTSAAKRRRERRLRSWLRHKRMTVRMELTAAVSSRFSRCLCC